jgi:hypothetical protein
LQTYVALLAPMCQPRNSSRWWWIEEKLSCWGTEWSQCTWASIRKKRNM